MGFGQIFNQIKDALDGDNEQQPQNQGVLPASQDPLGDPADQEGYVDNAGYNNYNNGYDQGQYNQGQYNQGQYDQGQYDQGQFGNVLPASQDPLGDPADQEAGFGNVLPASQDPYGDPADQEEAQNQPHHGGLAGVLENIFVRRS